MQISGHLQVGPCFLEARRVGAGIGCCDSDGAGVAPADTVRVTGVATLLLHGLQGFLVPSLNPQC